MKILHWFGLMRVSEARHDKREIDICHTSLRLQRDSIERISLACNLHIEEIKRLEEELAQARVDRDIKHARRSEASRKGWEKRRAA